MTLPAPSLHSTTSATTDNRSTSAGYDIETHDLRLVVIASESCGYTPKYEVPEDRVEPARCLAGPES